MKPAALLSFLKEEIDYNNQLINEAKLSIKSAKLEAILNIGFFSVVISAFISSLAFLLNFYSSEASFLLSALPITFFIFYQIPYKKSSWSKIQNKFYKKLDLKYSFSDKNKTRLSKVSDEHLNQIKLSLTLDQYKALHIKHPNPCYQDVINFLENIDEVNTAIAQAEESKHIIISTDDINIFKEESIQNVVQQ